MCYALSRYLKCFADIVVPPRSLVGSMDETHISYPSLKNKFHGHKYLLEFGHLIKIDSNGVADVMLLS